MNLLQVDRTVFDWINSDWSSSILDVIMPWISRFARPPIVRLWMVLIGLPMVRHLALSNRTGQGRGQHRTIIKTVAFFCLYMALIYGINTGVCNSLKRLLHRSRPFVEQTVVLRISSKAASYLANDSSFPSGHAWNAFMIAALLADQFRRKKYVFYCLATLVALSRVYLGVHYPSDVLSGAALGLSITWLMLTFCPLRNTMLRD